MKFLYMKQKALSAEACDALISVFEASTDLQAPGETAQGYDPEHKSDTEIRIEPQLFVRPEWALPLAPVFPALQTAVDEYKTRTVGLNLISPWALSAPFNMQRYLPGEGYRALHCEVDAGTNAGLSRVLTWILYLNTITDQGGTFFPNQDTTVTAEQGKLLISPAYWTHSHQGIVSPTQTKYILTGWYQFC